MLARKTYLISASLGPISTRARRLIDGYLDVWAAEGAPDIVWTDHAFPAMARLKATFAGIAGCDADELAITTNISIAVSTIASALDLRDRPKIVLSELDFPTDGHVWLAQHRRGAEIEWLRSADGLTIPLEEYDRAIDERTAVVMVNRVLYRSSALVDARAVCAIARERGALSFVDDYHGAGIVPLDLHELGCDLYTAGVLKWLCGGPGLAFLYARRDLLPSLEPAVTGWFASREPFSFDTQHLEFHPTARRLEHGTPPVPSASLAQAASTSSRRSASNASALVRGSSRSTSSPAPMRRGFPSGRRASERRGAASSTSASARMPSASATRSWIEGSAPTTAATGCGSRRTSSTPTPTSTAASTSGERSRSPRWTSFRRGGAGSAAHESSPRRVEAGRREGGRSMTSPFRTLPEMIQRLKQLDALSDPVANKVGDLLGPGRLKDALAGTWLGHPAHPVLTDVVVGAWTSAFVLDVVGRKTTETAADTLVGVGVLSAVPTALTGLADWVDTWGPTRRVGTVHAVGNLAAASVYGLSWIARRRGARGLGVALGMLGMGIASGTAYLGGHLVYGRGVGVDAGVFDHGPAKWTAVADEADLPVNGALAVDAGDTEIALFRQDGWICAIAERCTHRGAPLHKGEVENDRVTCPWHGSQFDVCSGSVLRGPATAPQQAFETRVQDGKIEVRRARD